MKRLKLCLQLISISDRIRERLIYRLLSITIDYYRKRPLSFKRSLTLAGYCVYQVKLGEQDTFIAACDRGKSKTVLNSGFHIVDSWFQEMHPRFCQRNLDSGPSSNR